MELNGDNKQKILNNALELFSKYGYDSVGVQLLAEKSGITKPTLYYYFGNKEGVYRELLKSNYEKFDSIITKASVYKSKIESYEEDVYPVLLKVAKTYFDFASKNQDFYRMALLALFSPPTSKTREIVFDLNNNQYKIIKDMFLKMSEAHHNMKKREELLSRTFIGMINSYITMLFDGSNKLDENTVKKLVKQFMHGIFV